MASDHDIDLLAALEMEPLFSRGREALATYIAGLNEEDQPLGGTRAVASVDVVTYADFVSHAPLCMRHVIHNGRPTQVLCESGRLCLLVEKRFSQW